MGASAVSHCVYIWEHEQKRTLTTHFGALSDLSVYEREGEEREGGRESWVRRSGRERDGDR